MSKHLLLLSNSTMAGKPYLGWPEEHIKSFLGDVDGYLLFIPFAGVTVSYDEYSSTVRDRFGEWGYEVKSVHEFENKIDAAENAAGFLGGGGNTFQLLKCMYEFHLVEVVRNKVLSGSPYIGWSAGSNLTCPSIKTTNDMPIVQPPSFIGLDLIPFQINPHYTEKTIPGHGGESRKARIEEFIELNSGMQVAGLPEGMLIEVHGENATLKGNGSLIVYEKGMDVKEFATGADLSFLL